MIIKDAAQATEEARRIIGNPIRFQPKEAKRVSGYWVVEAVIGVLDDILVTVTMPETVLEVKEGYMKAILAEHRFPIPEELKSMAKAIVDLNSEINLKAGEKSFTDAGIINAAFRKLKDDTYRQLALIVGTNHHDYPVWNVSDSGDELIGYKYEFQEEG